MQRSIKKRVRYRHPPDRVWKALTTREALAVWLMPNDFEPRVGHEFNFRTDPAPGFDGIVHCEVLELDEPRRMVWSWRGGNIDTRVTFELRPTAQGTELAFEMSGFEGAGAILTSLILQSGFGTMYEKLLPQVLERYARGEPPGEAATCEQREHDPKTLGAKAELLAARVVEKLFARSSRTKEEEKRA